MDPDKQPWVAGVIDGTHIPVQPPLRDEASFLNRKQGHSINCLAVAGPKLEILYVDVNAPGRWHDSYVLQRSSLYLQWENVDPLARRPPFPGAVLLGHPEFSHNFALLGNTFIYAYGIVRQTVYAGRAIRECL